MIAFPDHLQALEREMLVEDVQIAGAADDKVRLPAGGDRFSSRPELFDNALQNAVDHSHGAEVHARLNARYGVGANHVLCRPEIHEGKPGGFTEQRLDGNADAHGDSAPQVLGVFRDHVEVDGGAEIHDDARTAVLVEARHAVYKAVGADLRGIIVTDGQADFGARPNEHGLGVEVTLGHEGEGAIDGRHDARDNHAIHRDDIQPGRRKQVMQENTPLCGGLLMHRPQAPLAYELSAVEG